MNISRRALLLDDGTITFDHTCDGGYLYGHYDGMLNTYVIDDFEVRPEYRRRQIGRQLLYSAKMTAESIEAEAIYAIIISRECLDAMTTVFDQKNIEVKSVGEYAPTGRDAHPRARTSARLIYPVANLGSHITT